MTEIVIGLTGLFGSGCGTAAKYLKEKGFKVLSLTDRIKKECRIREITNPQRHDLQNIGDELRKKFGSDFLARELKKKIHKIDKKIVIKSIRNNHEATFLRNSLQNFYLININAPVEIRYERSERTRDYTSKADFKRDDERDAGIGQPDHGQQVNKCGELADIIINNSWRKRTFKQKLDYYLELIKKPGSRPPSDIEINMAQAYFWSLRSQCLRRKVGAIIIKNGHTIASGFNDVPRKTIEENNVQLEIRAASCKEQFRKCYRKVIKNCLSCEAPISAINPKCDVCNTEVGKEQAAVLNKHLDLCLAIHAEERAILQVAKLGGQSLDKAALYTTTFPCQLCAKIIFEVGISEVIYISPYPFPQAKLLLDRAKVKLTMFEGVKSKAFDKLYGLSI